MKLIGPLSAAILLLFANEQVEAGLSTQVSQVLVENLKTGQTHNLSQSTGFRVTVTNTGSSPTALEMSVLVPDSSELRAEAEPIPDVSWIRLSPDSFCVAPGAQASADILISIPPDADLRGRRYQATVWSRTVGRQFISVGLKTRLIFTIDTVSALDVGIGREARAYKDRNPMPESQSAVTFAAACREGDHDTYDALFHLFSECGLVFRAGATEGANISLGLLERDKCESMLRMIAFCLHIAGKRSVIGSCSQPLTSTR
jgi:hypothetical protein